MSGRDDEPINYALAVNYRPLTPAQIERIRAGDRRVEKLLGAAWSSPPAHRVPAAMRAALQPAGDDEQ